MTAQMGSKSSSRHGSWIGLGIFLKDASLFADSTLCSACKPDESFVLVICAVVTDSWRRRPPVVKSLTSGQEIYPPCSFGNRVTGVIGVKGAGD